MTKMKHLIIAFLLSQLCCSAYAAGGSSIEIANPNDLSSELRSTPVAPIKIASARGVRWAEYCPDQTCEVLRVPARVSAESLAGIALVYFYYVNEYEYLKSWKARDDLRSKLDKFLQLSRTAECNEASSRALAICVLRSFHKKSGMELLFIRHDEGKTSVKKLEIDEQLK